MAYPHKKKHGDMNEVEENYNNYLSFLDGLPEEIKVTDDMRQISVKKLSKFIAAIQFWNLIPENTRIKRIGVYNTLDTESKQITSVLVPLDENGDPVMNGPGGPADGPSYIS
jgi:hypothetical protein